MMKIAQEYDAQYYEIWMSGMSMAKNVFER